jgi:HSP20 family protein
MARDTSRPPQSFFTEAARGFAPQPWQPSADVYRTQDGWLVKLDLAGVRPEDLHLAVQGRRLIVQGTRRDASVHECRCSYQLEIAYSQFERSVELPYELEQAHITSEYRDGMLMIRIHAASRG